jgi:hypothetical protein
MKKEIRVYVVNCGDSDLGTWELTRHKEKFMQEAEKLGSVYSLQGFQNAINDEELNLVNSFILII